MAAVASLGDELRPWKASLEAAVRNGELYSQPIPITDPTACNAIGQRYGGPVVLVSDSTTYSAGDLFSAGFVDNAIGPFVCVGEATGAGGANVWDYAELRSALAGSPIALPALPDGIGFSLAFRRATRSGPSAGLPIEDIGIAGAPYAMTRDDLLAGNRDLIAHCIALLSQQPASRLAAQLDQPTLTVTVTTSGLTRARRALRRSPRLVHTRLRGRRRHGHLSVRNQAGRAHRLVGAAGDRTPTAPNHLTVPTYSARGPVPGRRGSSHAASATNLRSPLPLQTAPEGRAAVSPMAVQAGYGSFEK